MQTYFQVGAGGTGTHLVPALLTYLRNHHENAETEYQLVIADGDSFDTGNLDRQVFAPGLVQMNKAEAMVHMNPGHPIIAVTRYVGADDLSTMIQDGDVILICADNYSVRKLIVDRCRELDNVVVINAGNEKSDGIVQLWVREDGDQVTPCIDYGHPEIKFNAETDRSAMDCLTAAKLPGGGRTLLANMHAAALMLQELQRWHSGQFREGWTESTFDIITGEVQRINMRERRNWAR